MQGNDKVVFVFFFLSVESTLCLKVSLSTLKGLKNFDDRSIGCIQVGLLLGSLLYFME